MIIICQKIPKIQSNPAQSAHHRPHHTNMTPNPNLIPSRTQTTDHHSIPSLIPSRAASSSSITAATLPPQPPPSVLLSSSLPARLCSRDRPPSSQASPAPGATPQPRPADEIGAAALSFGDAAGLFSCAYVHRTIRGATSNSQARVARVGDARRRGH